MKDFIQSFYKFARRTGRENSVLRYFRIESAQKNVEAAAEILLVLVTGQPPLQIAMKRHRINAELQIVKIPRHFCGNIFKRITGRIHSQAIRFPIDEIKTSFMLENEIDKAFHESVGARELQTIDCPHEVIYLKRLAQARRRKACKRKSELELGQT